MSGGVCAGVVAYNYASQNLKRMNQTIRCVQKYGLIISVLSLILFQLSASPIVRVFLSTSAKETLRVQPLLSDSPWFFCASILCIRTTVPELQHLILPAGCRRRTRYPSPCGGARTGFLYSVYVSSQLLFRHNRSGQRIDSGEICGTIFAQIIMYRWKIRNHCRGWQNRVGGD